MNHFAYAIFSCAVVCLLAFGCGKGDPELQPENTAATAAEEAVNAELTENQRISALTVSESSIFVDGAEIKVSAGLEAMASVLGQPDRKAGEEDDESWTWDGLGITAKGSHARIRSLYVKFGEFSARTGARSRYSGVVIVEGGSPEQEAKVSAESDAKDLTTAQSIHRGFSATSDAGSGNLLDIGVMFLSSERLQELDESPILRQNRTSNVQSITPPDTNGDISRAAPSEVRTRLESIPGKRK